MPIEVIAQLLQLIQAFDSFIQNRAIQKVLSDEELIDKALNQLDINQTESDRLKAKLTTMIGGK